MAQQLLFHGRTAVVTGAGGGIGRMYALELARRGCNVLVNDLESGGLGESSSRVRRVVEEIVSQGGIAVGNTHSVMEAESVMETAVRVFGKVDILINNAGILRDKSFLKMSMEEWQDVLDVHLGGTMRMSKAVWSMMLEQKYGRIVNIGSSAGLYGNFGQTNYSAAKMGILGFTNSLAIEGLKHNVLVNCVIPVADSKMTETVLSTEVRELLHPSHIVPMVLSLSHDTCTTTGATFELGGGFYSKVSIERSQGVVLGGKDSFATVESVAASMSKISERGEPSRPMSISESLQQMLVAIENPGSQRLSDETASLHLNDTSRPFKSSSMRELQSRFSKRAS